MDKNLNENSSSSKIFKLAKYDFLKFCNEYKAFEMTKSFKEPNKNDALEYDKKVLRRRELLKNRKELLLDQKRIERVLK